MLTKVYADNYKSLVNFEVSLRPLQLILGANGSGKTTLFEILNLIRDFVINGWTAAEVFPARNMTRWQTSTLQHFEIHVQRGEHLYKYEVAIAHDLPARRSFVLRECLRYDGVFIFNFGAGDVQLYDDNFQQGALFSAEETRSALANVARRSDNTLLTWFKDWLSRLFVIDMDPRRMIGRTEEEEEFPNTTLSNFSSWFRWLLQERPEVQTDLYNSLRECIDGFESLPLTQYGGTTRLLSMRQRIQGTKRPIDLTFDELSLGQRKLIALYTLLSYGFQDGGTLCIDEPDNYISLREIQPWLAAIQEAQVESAAQVLLISHHPEIINYLAPDCGLMLERVDNGPTRAKNFTTLSDLEPSELIARGWIDG